jgi:hypothetical protein
VAVRNGGLPKR